MRYIEGQSRDQVLIFPEVIDNYVSKENQVRVIDAFIAVGGVSLLFI